MCIFLTVCSVPTVTAVVRTLQEVWTPCSPLTRRVENLSNFRSQVRGRERVRGDQSEKREERGDEDQ